MTARKISVVSAALVSLMALSACNGGTSSTATESETPSEQAGQTPPSTPAAPTVGSTQYSFTITQPNDVELGVYLSLTPPVQANDPSLTTPVDCADNVTTAGVVTGTLTIVNNTADFEPDGFALVFIGDRYSEGNESAAGSVPTVGIHFSDGTECEDSSAFSPSLDGGDFGPVPIEFVIPSMYGPNGEDVSQYEDYRNLVLTAEGSSNAEVTVQPGVQTRSSEEVSGRPSGVLLSLP